MKSSDAEVRDLVDQLIQMASAPMDQTPSLAEVSQPSYRPIEKLLRAKEWNAAVKHCSTTADSSATRRDTSNRSFKRPISSSAAPTPGRPSKNCREASTKKRTERSSPLGMNRCLPDSSRPRRSERGLTPPGCGWPRWINSKHTSGSRAETSRGPGKRPWLPPRRRCLATTSIATRARVEKARQRVLVLQGLEAEIEGSSDEETILAAWHKVARPALRGTGHRSVAAACRTGQTTRAAGAADPARRRRFSAPVSATVNSWPPGTGSFWPIVPTSRHGAGDYEMAVRRQGLLHRIAKAVREERGRGTAPRAERSQSVRLSSACTVEDGGDRGQSEAPANRRFDRDAAIGGCPRPLGPFSTPG